MSPIKAIILTRECKYHDFLTHAETLRKFLAEGGEFDVAVKTDFSILASPELDSYDLLINYTHDQELTAAEEAGLLRFVADGKGLLGVHTATITFRKSTAYRELIGGWLEGHAPYGEFDVTIKDAHHPVTAGVGNFRIPDELYVCTQDPGICVLATANHKGKDEPLVWTKPWGKGRVCYVALGHDAASFAHPAFQRLVRQAAMWTAGQRSTRHYPIGLMAADLGPKGRYRAAVVGSGNIARNHVQAYKSFGNIQVVGAADISRDRLDWFKQQTGVDQLYTDYMEMIRAQKPEIVSVCTYLDSHCEIVSKLAASGVVKGILCEKPMALTMGQARQMIKVCDVNHVKLAVNHQRRFYSHHQKTKDLIDSGAIGKVQKLWASVTTQYKDPFVWATHVTDMIRFYGGDVESVMGQIADWAPEPSGQGGHRYCLNGVAYMKFASGVRGLFDFERNKGEIHIIGDRGHILVPMDRMPGEDLWASTDKSPAWTQIRHDGCGWSKGPMFIPAVHDLLEAVEQDKLPINSGIEGAASLEMLLAVFESARVRDRVMLPMKQEAYPLSLW